MAKQKFYKRQFRASLHRKMGNSTEVISVRYFSKLSKALSRGVELAILDGQPGDVLEITSSNFDYLIATVKLKVSISGKDSLDIKFHMAGCIISERAVIPTI